MITVVIVMLEPDDFGIPGNMFGRVSENFIRAIGRIVMLSPLVEDAMSGVVLAVSKESWDQIAGLSKGQLFEIFDKEAKSRELPSPLLDAVSEAKNLLQQRDELVHSLWPTESDGVVSGWRPVVKRKRGEEGEHIEWIARSDDDLRLLINRLVAVHASLRQLLWTAQIG